MKFFTSVAYFSLDCRNTIELVQSFIRHATEECAKSCDALLVH